jgi:hypothetical protein
VIGGYNLKAISDSAVAHVKALLECYTDYFDSSKGNSNDRENKIRLAKF